jgi:hypothetical protein
MTDRRLSSYIRILKIYGDHTKVVFNAPEPEKIQPWKDFQDHMIHYTLQVIDTDEY